MIAPTSTYLLSSTSLPFKLQEDFLPVDPPAYHSFSQFLLHKGHFRHSWEQGPPSSILIARPRAMDSLKNGAVIALYLYDKLITKPLKLYILFYSFLLFILSTFQLPPLPFFLLCCERKVPWFI